MHLRYLLVFLKYSMITSIVVVKSQLKGYRYLESDLKALSVKTVANGLILRLDTVNGTEVIQLLNRFHIPFELAEN